MEGYKASWKFCQDSRDQEEIELTHQNIVDFITNPTQKL